MDNLKNKKIFGLTVNIYLGRIILTLLLFCTGCLLLFYYKYYNTKWGAIYAGVCTGLFIMSIQFLLNWTEHIELEKIKKLGIKKVLPYRDNEEYYRNFIKQAKKEICLLGNTAHRFLTDFADKDRSDKGALLEVLGRGVKFRLLLPRKEFLHTNEDKKRADLSETQIQRLTQEYGRDKFSVRYFSAAPTHNLLMVDGECLVGPIFPNIRSKDCPAIHAYYFSEYVQSYLKYFEHLWKVSNGSNENKDKS